MNQKEADRIRVIKMVLELSNPPFVVISKDILRYYSVIPYKVIIRPLIIKDYESEDYSLQEIANKYKVTHDTVRWVVKKYLGVEHQKPTQK